MGYTNFAITGPGDLAGTALPGVGWLEGEPLHVESELHMDHMLEDIVGKSIALRKVLDHVAIVAPPNRRCSCTARPGLAKNCSRVQSITSARVASALSYA